jgi:hypothetical protein
MSPRAWIQGYPTIQVTCFLGPQKEKENRWMDLYGECNKKEAGDALGLFPYLLRLQE